MHSFSVWIETLKIFCAFPHHVDSLLIVNAIENAIATQCNKVVLLLDSESFDLRRCYKHLRIAAELWKLSLDISE